MFQKFGTHIFILVALILSTLVVSFTYFSKHKECRFQEKDSVGVVSSEGKGKKTFRFAPLTQTEIESMIGIENTEDGLSEFDGYQCPKNCEKHGNCNRETGQCECPFGRGGEACQVDLLPACRLAPDAPASCGHVSLKPCECLRQCFKYLCDTNNLTMAKHCDTLTRIDDNRLCFEREGRKYNETRNDPPSVRESHVRYFKGFRPSAQQELSDPMMALSNGVELSLPLDDCPNRCSNRGACLKIADKPDMAPKCYCLRGYEGDSCEDEITGTCPNDCSGRGICFDAWCHCEPPSWGIGCQRDAVYPISNSRKPKPVEFKIYIYDLPTDIAHQEAYWAGWEEHDPNYIAYKHFLHQLLSSPFVTQDPEQAHLFYIPALTYAYTSNLGDPNAHLLKVVDFVKSAYPWWNRTDGKDHILWTSEDRGACWLQHESLFSPIKLTHFGYFDTTQGGMYPMIISNIHNQQYACYHPLRDVVVPPYLAIANDWVLRTYVSMEKDLFGQTKPWKKKSLLFFAGSLRVNDQEYAGGARKELAKWYPVWNATDIDFNEGFVSDYYKSMHDSLFCFAPYGHGFGVRVSLAIMAGCIPVIIQDHVFQPFEEILPYEEFSIRLNNDDIEHLPDLLRSIGPSQIKKLQQGIIRYWKAFVFDQEVGGKAFDFTILALRRRYQNLKAGYYGRHRSDLF